MGNGAPVGLDPAVERRVAALAERLIAIEGVAAVALGGSHARGRARPGSDIDLGLLYAEAQPIDVGAVRALATELDSGGPAPGGGETPVVSELWEWGRWVNGGAWLHIEGTRVDWIYRAFEQVERTLEAALEGRHEVDYAQQPPFGYPAVTCLGEVAVCLPLLDPTGRLAALKGRVVRYPEPLRQTLIESNLRGMSFGLGFARKLAARGEVPGAVGCLARFANQLYQALFALERRYFVNDKTALEEIAEFDRTPRDFAARISAILAHPGATAEELGQSIDAIEALWGETAALCSDPR
jgi:hypothetical protein